MSENRDCFWDDESEAEGRGGGGGEPGGGRDIWGLRRWEVRGIDVLYFEFTRARWQTG